jgi:menaquinone-dependent protoporphyrinogen IX oxidase
MIVYESMFGSTRVIAESIAEGLGQSADVAITRAADVDDVALRGADLLVVGGPTQAWSMSRSGTRKGAPSYVDKPGSGLHLEPGADKLSGVREWLNSLPSLQIPAAAFDTRVKGPSVFTGRASKAIARVLTRHGAPLVAPPTSFLVDRKSHLLPGEAERARAWGSQLANAESAAIKPEA